MTAVLIISLILVWMFISGIIVISVAMMSSRLSQQEENPSLSPGGQLITGVPQSRSSRIPTQPRAEIAH